MQKYELWNRTDYINGIEPSRFLDYDPFKDYEGDIILIYKEGSDTVVAQVESKELLAEVYDIDKDLPLDLFMAIYFEKRDSEPVE